MEFHLNNNTKSLRFYRSFTIDRTSLKNICEFQKQNVKLKWRLIQTQSSIPVFMLTQPSTPLSIWSICHISTKTLCPTPEAHSALTRIPQSSLPHKPKTEHLTPPKLLNKTRIVPTIPKTEPTPLRAETTFNLTPPRKRSRPTVPEVQIATFAMNFQPPPVRDSIENNHVIRVGRNIPEQGQGFIFPISMYLPYPIEYQAPGWLSDPRFTFAVPRIRSGSLYICIRSKSATGEGLRAYYVLMPNLHHDPEIPCISLSDNTHFIVFAPLRGVSEYTFRELYKQFLRANKFNRWVPLTTDRENDFFFLSSEMPHNQHKLALSLIRITTGNPPPFQMI